MVERGGRKGKEEGVRGRIGKREEEKIGKREKRIWVEGKERGGKKEELIRC